MKKQDGFATLEVVLVTAIISTLAFVAVPKIDRIMDKLFLDYEVKRFCSEVDFARSSARSTFANRTGIFVDNGAIESGNTLTLHISYDKNQYELKKSNQKFHGSHKLSGGVVLQKTSGSLDNIEFKGTDTLKSGTVRFVSRRGKISEVKIDSVGRAHGEKNVE